MSSTDYVVVAEIDSLTHDTPDNIRALGHWLLECRQRFDWFAHVAVDSLLAGEWTLGHDPPTIMLGPQGELPPSKRIPIFIFAHRDSPRGRTIDPIAELREALPDGLRCVIRPPTCEM